MNISLLNFNMKYLFDTAKESEVPLLKEGQTCRSRQAHEEEGARGGCDTLPLAYIEISSVGQRHPGWGAPGKPR